MRQNAAGLTGIYLPEDVVILLDELADTGADLRAVYGLLQHAEPATQRAVLWDNVEGPVYGRDSGLSESRFLEAERIMQRIAKRIGPGDATHVYMHLVRAMARALWVSCYADFVDNLRDDSRNEDLPKRERARCLRLREKFPAAGGGERWEDYAPKTPPEAGVAAVRLAERVAEENLQPTPGGWVPWIESLLEVALVADDKYPPARGRMPSSRPNGYHRYAAEFGGDLAMMALGHGVSWFDDHADFPLEMPRIEAYINLGRGDKIHFEVSGL